MLENHIFVCAGSALTNGGRAVKIAVKRGQDRATAFFVRYHDSVYGYLNVCPHAGSELDWENEVFTRAGDQLMCARHGATFAPDTGECTGGPCKPSRLVSLHVTEIVQDGDTLVLWRPDEKIRPIGQDGNA